MRLFLTRALKNAGYDVVVFDNGQSPMSGCAKSRSRCCSRDIVMPEMDGIELARRATELDPDLKVMFITGFAAVALNPDSDAPQGRHGAVQALSSQGPRQRSGAAAGRLTEPATGLNHAVCFMVYPPAAAVPPGRD